MSGDEGPGEDNRNDPADGMASDGLPLDCGETEPYGEPALDPTKVVPAPELPPADRVDRVERSPHRPTRPLPETIAGYRVLGEISAGGMGETYLVQQDRPIQRQIALKRIRADLRQSAELRSRFMAEQQALALMNHTNVAQVYDSGVTEDHEPYFTMEYIAGTPILEYCNTKRLSVRDRVRVVLQVASALEHIHSKGVIHRDLSHNNVLVVEEGDEPVAKVIDFGLVKSLGADLTGTDFKTEFQRQGIGTLPYITPEQLLNEPSSVDVRVDLYQLGVLLYYLLTETFPYPAEALTGQQPNELRRTLERHDPPTPTRRLSTLVDEHPELITRLAEARGMSTLTVPMSVPEDLDWIVMKAIAREKKRRYSTADALRVDLEAFLDGGTVSARPPTFRYKLQKFVARHPVLLALNLTIALSLFGVGVATGRPVPQNLTRTFAYYGAGEAARQGFRAVQSRATFSRAVTSGAVDAPGSSKIFVAAKRILRGLFAVLGGFALLALVRTIRGEKR